MKSLKALFVIAVVFVSSAAFAQAESADVAPLPPAASLLTTPANLPITKGHWQVGGGFSYYRTSEYDYTTIDPRAEYFLIDRLSLGGVLMLSNSSSGRAQISIGPSATYYFYQSSRYGFYASQSVLFTQYRQDGYLYDNQTLSSGQTGLGVSTFLSPTTAFGVELAVHYEEKSNGYFLTAGTFKVFF